MITYSNTKPWITVHFNPYKLNRCVPAAGHTNYHFSSKQISQEMHTRDIFSILYYYFIISQFSLTEAFNRSRQDLFRSYIYPLNNFHLHVYFLHLAASSNSSARATASTKQIQIMLSSRRQILSFHCSCAVKSIYRARCSCYGCYNTTTDHLRGVDGVPAHRRTSKSKPFQDWFLHFTLHVPWWQRPGDVQSAQYEELYWIKQCSFVYFRTEHLFSCVYRLCNYQTWGN